jgi:hypothetical protein
MSDRRKKPPWMPPPDITEEHPQWKQWKVREPERFFWPQHPPERFRCEGCGAAVFRPGREVSDSIDRCLNCWHRQPKQGEQA